MQQLANRGTFAPLKFRGGGESLYYRGMCVTQEQRMEAGIYSRVWGSGRSCRPSGEPLSTSMCAPAQNLSKPILLGLTAAQDIGMSDLTSSHSPLSRNQGEEVVVGWDRGWRVRKGVEFPALCLGLVPLATSHLL